MVDYASVINQNEFHAGIRQRRQTPFTTAEVHAMSTGAGVIPEIAVAVAQPPAPSNPNQSYTYQDLADFKKVKKHTVYKWVREGSIPSPVYIGGSARFTADQVALILSSTIVPGTYKRVDSTKAKAARKVMAKRMKAKATGKPPKKKPTPKKPKTKKGAKK